MSLVHDTMRVKAAMENQALATADPETIGERLASARLARGMTQLEAADAIGVGRTTITAMESGQRRPRPSELYALARLYGRQLGELLRPLAEGESPSFAIQFRSALVEEPSAAARGREEDVHRFERLCRWYGELEAMVETRLPTRYPEEYDVSRIDIERAAESIATAERNKLGLGDAPIGDLAALLETEVGLRVFAIPMQDRRTAGMFLATSDLGGCIAVNANHPADRQRWSLAYEYGHFLTHRFQPEITTLRTGRKAREERLADAFACYFLMPASSLIRRFLALKRAKSGPVTPADILELAYLYGVSAQAMFLRLEELELLRGGTWDALDKQVFKPDAARELIDIPKPEPMRRLPYRYESLVSRAFNEARISEGQLAQMLDTDRVSARRLVKARSHDEQLSADGEWRQVPIQLGLALADRV